MGLFTILSWEGRRTLNLPACRRWFEMCPFELIPFDSMPADAHLLFLVELGRQARNSC